MRLRLVAFLVGVAFVVAGTAFIFWPASLILAGLGLVAFGLLADDGSRP